MQTAIVCRCFTKEFVKAARFAFLVVGVPIILHLLFAVWRSGNSTCERKWWKFENTLIIVIFIKTELKFNDNYKVISLGRITAFKLLTPTSSTYLLLCALLYSCEPPTTHHPHPIRASNKQRIIKHGAQFVRHIVVVDSCLVSRLQRLGAIVGVGEFCGGLLADHWLLGCVGCSRWYYNNPWCSGSSLVGGCCWLRVGRIGFNIELQMVATAVCWKQCSSRIRTTTTK